ncbi:MAG TPA: histidine kinase [Terriglobales bacterium]|nr:histidine kinase [Terriglobales bacterium]
MSSQHRISTSAWAAICLGWAVVVILFAAQWYAYDVSHGMGEPFAFYLAWSGFMWVVLTPTALWLGWKFPITFANWRTRLPLHLAASVALTGVQISLEAYFGWLLHHESLSPGGALRHYFKFFEQISLSTYWLLLAGVLFYKAREDAREGKLRAAKLETQLSEARLEALRRQLHPHFLFNTLQAAITFVHEDGERAEDILLRLSELLRVTLENSGAHEIPLARELEILSLYTGIQASRFGDRLRFEVSVSSDVLSCAVPPMILQPLVENAVTHGIGRHKGKDTVTIRGFRQDSSLRLEIQNCSSQLEDSAADLAKRGIGLAMTQQRLEELYGKDRAFLHVTQLAPQGVCAGICIPLRLNGSEAKIPATQAASS